MWNIKGAAANGPTTNWAAENHRSDTSIQSLTLRHSHSIELDLVGPDNPFEAAKLAAAGIFDKKCFSNRDNIEINTIFVNPSS